MKLIKLCFGLVLVLLAGCVNTPTYPVDSRVTIAKNLASDVVVTDVRVVKSKGGPLVFQANVVNTSYRELWLEWKIAWLDASGMEIDSVVSAWNRVALISKDIKSLKGVAPSDEAVNMRFYVRRCDR